MAAGRLFLFVTISNLMFFRFSRPASLAMLLAGVAIFLAFPLLVRAGSIAGKVTDGTTGEIMPGVRIMLVGRHSGAISGLDGSYHIKRLKAGSYSLRFSYSGYLDTTIAVVLAADSSDETLDVALRQPSKEVIVTAKTENGSDINALERVRNSETVINAVSARSIEVSPDIDVADVSQRLSGVSMTRTAATGDAEYAIIRGMDPRYNYTTVNGIKIPSPDNKNEYVPLDIFPAGLLDRLEVTKTLTPEMEGDATGGVMNLVMKQAPEHEVLSVDLGSGYNSLFGGSQKFYTFTPDKSQSPRNVNGVNYVATTADFPSSTWSPRPLNFLPDGYFSLTAGNRFGDQKQFGLIVAGTYQNSYRGANTLFFANNINPVGGNPILTDFENRTYSILQTRMGGMANMDYRVDPNNTLQLFGMYASLQKQEVRNMFDTVNSKGTWPINPEVDNDILATDETQNIANATLSGKDVIFGKDLQADWHLAYSQATLKSPDQAYLTLEGGVHYTTNPPAIIPYTVYDSKRIWENTLNKDLNASLNLHSTEDLLGTTTDFTYGGMYTSTSRHSNYDNYALRVLDGTQYYNGNIAADTFIVYNPFGTASDPLNYDANQNITAAYAQAKFFVGPVSVLAGARMEQTDLNWLSSEPAQYPGKTDTIDYTDILPSISLKYSQTENMDWRASYFKSIARPTFYEIIPSQGVPGDDYTEVSNDSLRHTQINNLDLRWEFFPGGLDQLLVGGFYKQLHDPIEWVVEFIQVHTQLQPQNLGDATNYGFEVDFRKFFSNFGISGNYTYTHSAITTPKVELQYVKGVGATYDTVEQTRPLEGQSDNIGNLSLLYKDFESGTDAQVSAVYTGPAIVGVSTYLNNDVWTTGFTQLDLSGEQKIWGNLSIYLKVTNILNTPQEEVLHEIYHNSDYPQPVGNQVDGQDILIRKEFYERTYILGVRFKM